MSAADLRAFECRAGWAGGGKQAITVSEDDFRVIASSELAPYCTYGVSGKVDDKWAKKVKEALIALDSSVTVKVGSEEVEVLKRGLITGFEELQMSDYDQVRGWAKLAKMPPYEEY